MTTYIVEVEDELRFLGVLAAMKEAGVVANWHVNDNGETSVDKPAETQLLLTGDTERCVDCEGTFQRNEMWVTIPPFHSTAPTIYQCQGCREYMINMALKGHAATLEEKGSTDPRRSAA